MMWCGVAGQTIGSEPSMQCIYMSIRADEGIAWDNTGEYRSRAMIQQLALLVIPCLGTAHHHGVGNHPVQVSCFSFPLPHQQNLNADCSAANAWVTTATACVAALSLQLGLSTSSVTDRLAAISSRTQRAPAGAEAGSAGLLNDGKVTACLDELEAELQGLLAGRQGGTVQGTSAGQREGEDGKGKTSGLSAEDVLQRSEAAGLVCGALQVVERQVSAYAKRRWKERLRQWGEESQRGGSAQGRAASTCGEDSNTFLRDGGAAGGGPGVGSVDSAEVQGAMVRVMAAVRQVTKIIDQG